MFRRTLILIVTSAAAFTTAAASADTSWSPAGQLAGERYLSVAATLADGRVLLAGGSPGNASTLRTAQTWDPRTNQWSGTGSMADARRGATAVTLPDGRVLVAGGESAPFDYLDSAELYAPATGTWSPAGTMTSPRVFHAAVALADGRVLAVGGDGSDSDHGAEIWSPATNQWTATGPVRHVRTQPAIARLADGRVLVAGGWNGAESYLASAEIYDPAQNSWSDAGALSEARHGAGASVLPDGRVLVAGGYGYVLSPKVYPFASRAADIFNPATGAWTRTGNLNTPRGEGAVMVTLADGRPAIAGGFWWTNVDPSVPSWSTDSYERTAEVYDVGRGTWTLTPAMTEGRAGHVAVAVADGSLLVAGGFGAGTLTERILPAPPAAAPTATPTPTPTATVSAPPPQQNAKPGTLAFAKLPKRLKPTSAATIAIKLRCSGGACRDTLVLKRGKTVLAKRAFTAEAGRSVTVKLKLSAAIRRKLRGHTTAVTLELQRQHLRATSNLKGLAL